MRHGPAVRRRKLGVELRKQRTLAGLTSEQAAGLLGWHQSKVSRIETGQTATKPADVLLLLDTYGVSDPELRRLIEALSEGAAGQGRGGGWWMEYRDLLPPGYRDFISLESEAAELRTLETTVIPGLLQTRRYARAVTRAALAGAPIHDVRDLVEVRLARQAVLQADPPLALHAVLDESVLRRRVGDRGLMAEQHHHLQVVGRYANVTLQVLPFTSGVNTGVNIPFVIFSFSHGADLDVVVVDHLTSSLYLERKEDVRAYSEAFDALRAQALPPQKSLEFMGAIGAGA